MRKLSLWCGLAAAAVAALSGCGGAPESPHIYVVGVDCSRSFWNAGFSSEKRFTGLPKRRVQETAYRIMDTLNEISIVSGNNGFVRTVRVDGGSLMKTVDRDAIQREIENAIDYATVLTGKGGDGDSQEYLVGKVKGSMEGLRLALNKRNYTRRTEAGPVLNEDITAEGAAKVLRCIARVESELDRFSTTVSLPGQPQFLRGMQGDVNDLLGEISRRIEDRGRRPIDRQWAERNVYGSLTNLSPAFYFTIGDAASTSCRPLASDLQRVLGDMVRASTNGLRPFSRATDYRSFFQRSMSEIGNLLNDWGAFDRDIGVSLTYIIIGDAKNDPAGRYENSVEYSTKLIEELKESFAAPDGGSPIVGLPWDAIREIRIKILVPQKWYKTDILDAWTKLLQDTVPDRKLTVNYYMFDNLKENGNYSGDAIEKLLE